MQGEFVVTTLPANANENTKKALIYSQHISSVSKNHTVESIMHYCSKPVFLSRYYPYIIRRCVIRAFFVLLQTKIYLAYFRIK